jgi:hypothetical protein
VRAWGAAVLRPYGVLALFFAQLSYGKTMLGVTEGVSPQELVTDAVPVFVE